MATPSRQFYLDACQRLADRLAELGFRYRRSNTTLRLDQEEWTCDIRLQTTRYNAVDHVDVLINPSLSSERVLEYRRGTGREPVYGSVAGGFLEYWAPYDPPFRRNLAGAQGDAVLNENVTRIQTGPLVVLALLRQPPSFTSAATDLMLLHSGVGNWVDYLATYEEHQQIPALLERYAADLRWNDGRLLDQRRILVDAQRLARGLSPITDMNPSAAANLVERLVDAGHLNDLLVMSL